MDDTLLKLVEDTDLVDLQQLQSMQVSTAKDLELWNDERIKDLGLKPIQAKKLKLFIQKVQEVQREAGKSDEEMEFLIAAESTGEGGVGGLVDFIIQDVLQSYNELEAVRNKLGKRHQDVILPHHDLGLCCMNWGVRLRERFPTVGKSCMRIALLVLEQFRAEFAAQTEKFKGSQQPIAGSDPEKGFRSSLFNLETDILTGLSRCHSYLENAEFGESFARQAIGSGLRVLDEIGSVVPLCNALEELARARFEREQFQDACLLFKQHIQMSLPTCPATNETLRSIKWLGNTLSKLSETGASLRFHQNTGDDDSRDSNSSRLGMFALACYRHCLAAACSLSDTSRKQDVLKEYGECVRGEISRLKAIRPTVLASEWRKVSLENVLNAIGPVPEEFTPRALAQQPTSDISAGVAQGNTWASLSLTKLESLLSGLRSDAERDEVSALQTNTTACEVNEASMLGQRVVFAKAGACRRLGTCISELEQGLIQVAFGDGEEETCGPADVEQAHMIPLLDDLCAVLGKDEACRMCAMAGISATSDTLQCPATDQLLRLCQGVFGRVQREGPDEACGMLSVVTDCAFWALGMARRDADDACAVTALNMLGNVLDSKGEFERALGMYQEALDILQSTWLGEIPGREMPTHTNLAITCIHLGDMDAACHHFRLAGLSERAIHMRIAQEVELVSLRAKPQVGRHQTEFARAVADVVAAASGQEHTGKCLRGHPLEKGRAPYATWGCDRCASHSSADELAWRCAQCTFDLCEKCYIGFTNIETTTPTAAGRGETGSQDRPFATRLLESEAESQAPGEVSLPREGKFEEEEEPNGLIVLMLHIPQLEQLQAGKQLPPAFPDKWRVPAALSDAYGTSFAKARVVFSVVNKGGIATPDWPGVSPTMLKELCAEARQLLEGFSPESAASSDETEKRAAAVLLSSLTLDCDLHCIEWLHNSGENEWLNQMADRTLLVLSSLCGGRVFVATNDSSCCRSKTLEGPAFLAWSLLAKCRILHKKARYCSRLGLYQESLECAKSASAQLDAFHETFREQELPDLRVFGGCEPVHGVFASISETLFTMQLACGNELSESLRRCGDMPQAIAITEDLLRRLEERGVKSDRDVMDQGMLLGNLGTKHYHNQDYVLAAKYFKKGLEVWDVPNPIADQQKIAVSHGNYGNALNVLGLHSEAKYHYEKAIAILKAIDTQAARNSLSRFSTALATLGDAQGVQQDLETALPVLAKSYAASLASDELQLRAFIATKYAAQLRRAGDLDTACSVLEEGLAACERMQASLADNDRLRVSIFETQTILYRQIQKVLLLQHKPSDSLVAADRGKGRALAYLMAAEQGPCDQSSGDMSWPEMQAFARKEQCHVVVFSVLEADPTAPEPAELVAWVVAPDGALAHTSVSPLEHSADLDGMVNESRSALSGAATGCPAVPRGKLRVQLDTEGDQLRRMFALLMKPLMPALAGAAHVLLIPHRQLFMIPWAALIDERGRYLVELFTLRLCPSFRVAAAASHAVDSSSSRRPHKIAFVGNPWPIPDSLQEDLASLPFAAAEATGLAELVAEPWRSGTVGLLTELDATKQRVAEATQGASWLHFSCHGLLQEKALVLSGAESDDALLTTKEVQENLLGVARGSTAVLGACNSGCGDVTGEGVLGLSRAFLAAGAASVLVSLWNVDDKWTKSFMERLYGRLLEGMTVPEASRMTMLAMVGTAPVESTRAAPLCLHPMLPCTSPAGAEEKALLEALFDSPLEAIDTSAAVWGWGGISSERIKTAQSATLRRVLGRAPCRHETGRLCQHTKCAEVSKPEGGLLGLLHLAKTPDAATAVENPRDPASAGSGQASGSRARAVRESILMIQERLAVLEEGGETAAKAAGLKPRQWAPFLLVGSSTDMPLTRQILGSCLDTE